MEADGIVGASAVAVHRGQVVARVAVGYQDRDARVPVDTNTLFHWGSITKTLTAVAVMQQVQRGRLSLDHPVVRDLPELRRIHDPFGGVERITVRMLLSHSAGFRNGTWPYAQGAPWEPFEPTTWEQLVAMMPYQQLLFPPGERYGYSNPAYVYLARLVEQRTGDPWDSYIHKNLFTPLGLTRSYFRGTPVHLVKHRGYGYTVVRDSTAPGGTRLAATGPDFDPGITTPNGGWNAPVGELARYVAWLTGVLRTEATDAVLSREALELMWRPVVPMAEGYEASPDQGIGLGFFVRQRGAQRIVGHTGFQGGYRSFFYFDPESTRGIVVAFNTTNEVRPDTAGYARVHALGLGLLK
ncbi:MAG: beta-lactamase family protein [Gemmatimonadetes bacterium]|nr:beta-lactamase family protein [Gemmatimonadota bacterium]